MLKGKTHFEQVPLEMIEKMADQEVAGNDFYRITKLMEDGEVWIADFEQLDRAEELIASLESYWPGEYVIRESPNQKFVN